MRYFDNINDIVAFLEEKGKKNEIYLKKLNNSIYIELKILSPNGKQDNMLLEIKAQEISDKEIISVLVKKVENLENEVELLKKKVNNSEQIISENKNDIISLRKEIQILKNPFEENNKKENNKISFDSKITNINEIDFIINHLKESPVISKQNIQFRLLYRGKRDGDDSQKVHKMCDGFKNVIIFMKNDKKEKYGGFSNIGWET